MEEAGAMGAVCVVATGAGAGSLASFVCGDRWAGGGNTGESCLELVPELRLR